MNEVENTMVWLFEKYQEDTHVNTYNETLVMFSILFMNVHVWTCMNLGHMTSREVIQEQWFLNFNITTIICHEG